MARQTWLLAMANNLLVALIPHDTSLCDARYLYHYLQARKDDLFVPLMLGTANVSLKERDIAGVEISLPPIEEQRRIVRLIDDLARRVEEAVRLRAQSDEETDALKDAKLRSLINGISGSTAAEIGELCEVRGGIQKSPDRAPGANPVRYITVAHVQRDHLDISDERYFEVSREELTRWRLQSGDVLIIEGNGSADQIGRACLFRGEIQDCVHQNHVIRLRPNESRILPEYLNFFLNSPAGRDEVQCLSRTTSGLRTLSVGRIRSIRIPVPTLLDQHRLLENSRSYISAIEAIKTLQMRVAAELDAILPAILDRAFKGELS